MTDVDTEAKVVSSSSATAAKRKRAPWELKGLSSVVLDKLIGSGAFGLVFKASERESGDIVALKKIKIEPHSNQGFPVTAIREIRILKSLKHENIIGLKEIIVYKSEDDEEEEEEEKKRDVFESGGLTIGDVFMVFEYCFCDLSGLLKTEEVEITNAHVKCYMKQLLTGMHYLHLKKVLHRDIKSANILVTRNNVIKIADWGMARTYMDTTKQDFTNLVVTLWYRSPELLLGCRRYGSEVDIWSIGCVFLEMKNRVAPIRTDTEIAQLEQIYQLCGYPIAPALFEKYKQYPNWEKYATISTPLNPAYIPKLRHRYSSFDEYELSLLEKLLDIDPATRITASPALDDNYFWHEKTLAAHELRSFDSIMSESITEHLVQKKRREDQKSKEVAHDKAKDQRRQQQQQQQQGHANPNPHKKDYHQDKDSHADASGRGRGGGGRARFDGRSGGRFAGRNFSASSKYKILDNPTTSTSTSVSTSVSTAISTSAAVMSMTSTQSADKEKSSEL